MMIHKMPSVAAFALKHPDSWHSFASDRETVESVCAANNLGIVEVSTISNQFRLKSAENARRYCAAHGEKV